MASSTPAGNDVAHNLLRVVEESRRAAESAGRPAPRVVAVSKTKPVSDILAAYNTGHRDFGENYVQEIVEKSPQLPVDIRWRFIGHLQSNKVKTLLEGVPGLACLETLDTEKLANKLNNAVEAIGRAPLTVFVQVNTSGEESKFGVKPQEAVSLCSHVAKNCPNLVLGGLMTIGMPDYTSRPENFQTLSDCRNDVCAALGLPLELSMGMSNDYTSAIELGSTSVRVGSKVFGQRE
jgi:pyridoxal phosphate enzyme (YggS family)